MAVLSVDGVRRLRLLLDALEPPVAVPEGASGHANRLDLPDRANERGGEPFAKAQISCARPAAAGMPMVDEVPGAAVVVAAGDRAGDGVVAAGPDDRGRGRSRRVATMTMTVDGGGRRSAPSIWAGTRMCMCASRRLTQVREHTESLDRQYELALRAQCVGLGRASGGRHR